MRTRQLIQLRLALRASLRVWLCRSPNKMNGFKSVLIVLTFAFLSISEISASELIWPENKGEPYPWPKDRTQLFEILEKASETPLGTISDEKEIKKAVSEHMEVPDLLTESVMWFTPDTVAISVAYQSAPLAGAGFIYVLEKKENHWAVKTRYMLWVS